MTNQGLHENFPFFSIVIPAYNCKQYIRDAIDSVINQSCKNWELIIVDDMSTDGTYEDVREYIDPFNNIRLVRMDSNSGSPSGPRDLGVSISNGRYIGFLDADDMYLSNKLEKHYQYIKENPCTDFIHSAYNIVDENKNFIKIKILSSFTQSLISWVNFRRFFILMKNPICVNSVIVSKSLIAKYPFRFYPSLLSGVEDYANYEASRE